ncbi:membrane protein insertion efficiency factor YidD [Entomohabitans teleogrylli]|uniref:membrane protein insertion efficiency factor YidD n=1 Tax=Entomohabitans teleogrylli TaxID=1384589 RepID=UPI0008FC6A2B|nr:membrane protein insertion efficiency factor YidD [Entomohabitans teleogrylli]
MARVWILLINGYQRYLSPHKGFRCAFGALHHSSGCSEAVKQIIQRQGLTGGWPDIRQRFADCRQAAEQLEKRRDKEKKRNRCDCMDFAHCQPPDSCSVPRLPGGPDSCDCIPDCSCLSIRGLRGRGVKTIFRGVKTMFPAAGRERSAD